MRTIDDLDVAGRLVLVRSDLNVPLDTSAPGGPRITDDGRIRAALPAITKLADRGSHQALGIVTDVGLFIEGLREQLCGR